MEEDHQRKSRGATEQITGADGLAGTRSADVWRKHEDEKMVVVHLSGIDPCITDQAPAAAVKKTSTSITSMFFEIASVYSDRTAVIHPPVLKSRGVHLLNTGDEHLLKNGHIHLPRSSFRGFVDSLESSDAKEKRTRAAATTKNLPSSQTKIDNEQGQSSSRQLSEKCEKFEKSEKCEKSEYCEDSGESEKCEEFEKCEETDQQMNEKETAYQFQPCETEGKVEYRERKAECTEPKKVEYRERKVECIEPKKTEYTKRTVEIEYTKRKVEYTYKQLRRGVVNLAREIQRQVLKGREGESNEGSGGGGGRGGGRGGMGERQARGESDRGRGGGGGRRGGGRRGGGGGGGMGEKQASGCAAKNGRCSMDEDSPLLRIGIFVDRSVEYIVGVLASLYVGAAFVPFDTSWEDGGERKQDCSPPIPSHRPLGHVLAQQEDIHSLDATAQNHKRALDDLNSRFQQLQQTVAAPAANTSNMSDRLNALEIDMGTVKDGMQHQHTATQPLEQWICTAAAHPSSSERESTPKWDSQTIILDSSKTDPVQWFRKFELTLQLHYVSEHKNHAYLYSRLGGACQAWLDNLLSKYGVIAADLHTKISWEDLKAAWHKRFQVEPPEIKAMDKLLTFEQGTLPSVDWIAEYQRLTSVPDLQMGFKAIRHYFISRSCPTLSNALTHVEDTLMTTAELFDKATQIIITNKEAKNLRSSAAGPSRDQHRPRVAVVAAATPFDQTSEARYDDNNAPLMYVRIQVGQASYNALLDSGASRNFMSQSFMQRAGLGAQVRRKAKPTAIKLADGKTQQLLNRYIEAVPVYFAPHACEPVTFDILDTDFDIILGMPWLASADHTVNFHRRTLSVRNAFGAEVACTIPLPHRSIRCQVVTAKSFRATCAYEQSEEIGLCFLRTVAVADASPTDLSLDPWVVRLLDEFADIFESPTGVVSDRPISHEIILEAGAVPPKGCIYRMSEEELEVLRAQLDDLLAKGWIRPSSSPYGAPVLFVWKKNKDLRLCIDYRKLNVQIVKNAGPLPRIDELLERLGGAKYFSKLDLKLGYHQISIRPNDRYKSAFKTWYGHFEWVVMPFGLTNAPTTFQAVMTNEFRAMLDRFVLVYLDDILIYSRSLEDHLGHLRRVLETLRRAKYKANRDKCEFVRQELEYLGHFVTPEGISPLSDKIQAIQEWPEPRNVTDVRSFLGLAGYYQRFIKGYSKIVAHLNKLQCEDRPFDFGEEARESFFALKAALLFAEVLRIYDPLLPTRVTTDASGYGIGAGLEQQDAVDWHPVEYFSKKVPIVHSIDDARKKELLAFVHALKRWRHFLLGRSQFRWVTDNNPLVFYKTQDTVNSTIARWMAFIDQLDFFPDHIPGKSNRFADAFSRRPDHCTAVYSTFEIDDDLRNSFIRGYQADPEFRDKYSNCSSPNPAPSHYRIQEGYLLVHTRGKDLLCVPSDSHLRTRLLGEFHDAPATEHFGVNRTIGRLRERFCGRSAAVSRTVVVNPHPDDDGREVTAVQRSPTSPAPLREASGNNKDPPRQQFRSPSVCRGASARPQWMQSPSPLSAGSSAGRRVGECRETAPAVADVGDAHDGREVWAEQRRLMRSVREESITRGVQRLRVGEDGHDGEEAVGDAHDPDWNDNGAEGGEDDAGYISRSKQAAAMGGRGGKTKSCGGNGRWGKRTAGKGSDAEGDVDGEGGRHFWSVDDIIALIRAKRDQDAHLQGMGHAYARMKPREWKWLDVATRLKKVGVDREADRCGKKWDNLMQQFKKVHHFQGLSGKQDFFQLSGKDRMSKGFNFNMDRAVYEEILGSTAKNHTINLKNVADTGAQGGVRLPSASSADPDGDGGAEHDDDDDDDGSTKGSSQTTGGADGFGKRKSTRQQTFEAMTECMEKHGALMASTVESNSKRHCSIAIRQCEALEAEIEVQKKHYAALDEVDDLLFWNEREGFAIVKLIAEARGYLVAVARGEQPPPIRRSIVLPHNSIPQHKIADKSELNAAKERALKVQGIALRVIHGWVFKSQNRQRGYHAAYQYALNHAATDIARAMWMGEDWRYCVSPMVVHHTLDMDMKLPLWFVGADVEDMHEDDGLAAYQEASIQRLVGAFTSAVIIAEATDGGRVSHERLKTMVDAMRMMLAATVWLMRMAGDDHRAHYDAWVFVQLTAKPTLVASMHRCFDARRHIMQAATVITDKLASPPITLIDPPMYVPDWASIGVKFSHDATLSSPMEAKKVDWLGTGPSEDEDDGKGDEQGSGGGR
ncbi:hypothetical protein CBR_g4472 [Chara braunii]|uniref:RNA-directed DNA polymerase n=1 Tax=Chara braunii TaxID=69332 RepID=A0A388KI45_CHABU|nr:hypothetical protein CBR_g4472 [Chara braunii]|eukprot:GBG69643.1 hypothetical protein CBR_g4472 [Chara braunii]